MKSVGSSAGIAACLILLGCGSSNASSDPETDATGGDGARGGASAGGPTNTTAGMPGAAGMRAMGGEPGAGGAPAMGGAGPNAAGIGGSNASGGVAGRTGEGGGGPAIGGAGMHAADGGRGGAAGRAAGGSGFGAGGRAAGGYAGIGAGGHVTAGSGGAAGLGPEAPGGRINGYGTVVFQTNSRVQLVRLETTMLVPPTPPASGTLFLWPGIQPDGANFEPIDNGVLQPVLTWGPSCAPGKQPRAYSTWWISGQYVNTYGNEPGYTGCQGGAIMSVDVGDTLTIDMALSGTVWTQTVTDEQSGEQVDYSIDLKAQAQNLAYFVIEEYSSAPVSEVIFTDTTLTFDKADENDCKLTARGKNDFVSVPVPSADGLTCSIADIILRAEGID